MAIHLYLDEQLTQQISEGDFSNPDADNYNGTDGEIKDRQIFVANEQTTLAAPIDDVQTDIKLTEPRFADAEYIVIGTEQMQILSGGGTASLTVRRAVANTVPSSHDADAPVYSGYDYTGLVVDPIDEFETDESVWYKPNSMPPPRVLRSTSEPRPTIRPSLSGVAARCFRAHPSRTRSISSCASPEQRTPFYKE